MAKKRQNPMRGMRFRAGSYEFRTVVGGKRLFFRLETADASEALKRKDEILNNPTLVPSPGVGQDVEKFIAYKVRRREYTVYTEESKGYVLGAFATFLGNDKPTGTITTADVQRYYDAQLKKHAVSTANTYLLAVRSFCSWATDVDKLMRKNVAIDVEPIQGDGVKMMPFCSADQVKKLIDECDDQDLKFILFCGFHAGLRKQEIIEAVPFWFDLENRRIDLRKTATIRFKDREERSIPMTPEFHAFLQQYGLHQPYMLKPHVVKGKSKYRYEFKRPFELYMESKGFGWMTPHLMRHSFASILVTADKSLYKVAKWLGDDPRVVEKHYAKLSPKHEEMVGVFGETIVDGKSKRVILKHRRSYTFDVIAPLRESASA